jgi:hypothetical protein
MSHGFDEAFWLDPPVGFDGSVGFVGVVGGASFRAGILEGMRVGSAVG